jgi:murein DD-endopeptidase MepM/ murein hydrolase activator NlpD
MPDYNFQEPPFSEDDTSPSQVLHVTRRPSRLARVIGSLFLIGAAVITAVSAVMYIQDGQAPTTVVPTAEVRVIANAATLAPTGTVPSLATATAAPLAAIGDEPAPDVLGALMLAEPDREPMDDLLYRRQFAFTIAPARPRAAPIEYTIQVGDTIEKIAKRFNITQDSIIWNNDVGYVNRLAVGTTLTIPPVDGILYKPTSNESIQSIADKFKVSPFAILDSEYNRLQAATPETIIPANELQIMIPGGVTKKVAIYWKPPVQTRNTGSGGVGQISFGGGPGSCGYVSNGGGDGSLGLPLSGYTVIRGFSSYHSGIDLAKPSGSPVFAAGSGTVIFAGWSEWGYGNAIVIAHTPTLWTLYGHLSRINVSCGQFVNRAAGIGAVGSTGNSTGPHLHFEVRVNGEPQNPVTYLGGF